MTQACNDLTVNTNAAAADSALCVRLKCATAAQCGTLMSYDDIKPTVDHVHQKTLILCLCSLKMKRGL